MKKMIKMNITALRTFKNWQTADQLAMRSLLLYREQLQLVLRAGLEPGTLDFQSGAQTTRPRCLPIPFYQLSLLQRNKI